MKTTVIVLALAFVGLISAKNTARKYDIDHQHFIPDPSEDISSVAGYEEIETTSEFWRQQAQNTLQGKLIQQKITSKPKNVVFFIGDGMSQQTIAATRMYLGNENRKLSFEEFPFLGTAKTYCVDRQVGDSACTATAYLSGVKTNYGMLNVAPDVSYSSCAYNREEKEFRGLLKWAQAAGLATGVVTNARITHATPAAAYASAANRDWEDNSYVQASGCDPNRFPDIAEQLIHGEVGKNLKVILGGGRRHFIPSFVRDEENMPGSRTDGQNLINEWRNLHGSRARYVWNKAGLQTVNPGTTDKLLGLFDSSHGLFNLEIDERQLQNTKPKLSEMVKSAIDMLSTSQTGFVLFVEGGKIDMAHHENRPRLALDETAEFSRAVEVARTMTNLQDTLIVVSSDHGHTMTYNGYPKRGSDVLGIASISGEDGLPYTTLSYANGPGFHGVYQESNFKKRVDISSGFDFENRHTQYPATVPLAGGVHGGEDVSVYASGPMAHLFKGNFEQNVIPNLIASAAQIGAFR